MSAKQAQLSFLGYIDAIGAIHSYCACGYEGRAAAGKGDCGWWLDLYVVPWTGLM